MRGDQRRAAAAACGSATQQHPSAADGRGHPTCAAFKLKHGECSYTPSTPHPPSLQQHNSNNRITAAQVYPVADPRRLRPYFILHYLSSKNDREKPQSRICWQVSATCTSPIVNPLQHMLLNAPCSSGWSFFWFPSIAIQNRGMREHDQARRGRVATQICSLWD